MNASATLVNVTVDDLYPDPRTGRSIIFDNGSWNIGQYCLTCAFKLDPAQTYQNSWHDITFNRERPDANSTATAKFNFTGSALSLYGILVQKTAIASASHLQFFIDDHPYGNFSHGPDGTDGYIYNATLFSVDSLPHGPHVFMVKNGEIGGDSSVLLLDYLVYTTQEQTPTNATTAAMTPTTVSSVSEASHITFGLSITFGILSGALAIVLCIWIYTSRRQQITVWVPEYASTPSNAASKRSAIIARVGMEPSQWAGFPRDMGSVTIAAASESGKLVEEGSGRERERRPSNRGVVQGSSHTSQVPLAWTQYDRI